MECGAPYLRNLKFAPVCISPQSPVFLTEAAAQRSGLGFKYPRLRDTFLMQPECSVMRRAALAEYNPKQNPSGRKITGGRETRLIRFRISTRQAVVIYLMQCKVLDIMAEPFRVQTSGFGVKCLAKASVTVLPQSSDWYSIFLDVNPPKEIL